MWELALSICFLYGIYLLVHYLAIGLILLVKGLVFFITSFAGLISSLLGEWTPEK